MELREDYCQSISVSPCVGNLAPKPKNIFLLPSLSEGIARNLEAEPQLPDPILSTQFELFRILVRVFL
jgi:hypothetical protein